MADGYPFEKRKEDVLDEDRVSRCRSTWERNGSSGEFLAGFFEKKLVGWIRLREDDFLTHQFGHDYRIADWELVQRNRDDVREQLLQAIRERYPEAIIQFSQPSQNRTARSFYLKQPDVEGGPTDLYLGRHFENGSPTQTDETQSSEVIPLEPEDDLTQYLPNEREYFPCRNLLAAGSARDTLAAKFTETLNRETTSGFALDGAHDGDGTIVLDRQPQPFEGITPTAHILYFRAASTDKSTDRLLNAAHRVFDEAGVEYCEVRLDEPSDREHNFLNSRGYRSLSKRMYFLRLPDGVDPPLK